MLLIPKVMFYIPWNDLAKLNIAQITYGKTKYQRGADIQGSNYCSKWYFYEVE